MIISYKKVERRLLGLRLKILFVAVVFSLLGVEGSVAGQNRLALQVSGEEACRFCDFAKLAYKPTAELQTRRDLFSFYSSPIHSEQNFTGFVTKVENTVGGYTAVVAFHGTRLGTPYGVYDAGIDASFSGDCGDYVSSLGENFRTHSGFSIVVMGSYNEICRALQRQGPFNEIVFTGHSMGAACAELAALKYAVDNDFLNQDGRENFTKVFVLSCPAIFNEEGVNIYHQIISGLNSIHIYKNHDIVTTPHTGDEYWYSVGIPGNINFEEDPGAIFAALKVGGISGIVAGVVGGMLFKNRVVGVVTGALGMLAGGYLGGFALRAHSTDDFTNEQIVNVMQRIQENFVANPDYGLGQLGRIR